MELLGIGPPPADLTELAAWALSAWGKIFLLDFARYLIPAGLAFVTLWWVLRRRLAHRRIQDSYPARHHLRREFLYSLSSLAIFAALGAVIVFATMSGWTRIYLDLAEMDLGLGGWGYWAVTLIAMILLHDAWFYWTHRAMHHRRLFRLFHRVHHRSHNPSPWAAYAFAPAEAVVQGLFIPLLVFWLPLHPSVIGLFMLHQIIRNVLGHSGFEIFPRGTARHPVGRFITTHTHHDLHHSKVTGNYCLYFTWWDRWMGTLREDYADTFDARDDQTASRPTPKPAGGLHFNRGNRNPRTVGLPAGLPPSGSPLSGRGQSNCATERRRRSGRTGPCELPRPWATRLRG